MLKRHLEKNSHPLQKYSEAKFKIIDSSLGLHEAIALLKQEQLSCLLIESQLKITGILTEWDLIQLLCSEKDLSFLNVGQVMTPNPIVLNVETALSPAEIGNVFQQHHIRHIPLVDNLGKGVGIITPGSILSSFEDSPNQKLATKNKLLGQSSPEKHDLNQVSLGDQIQARKEQKELLSKLKFLKAVLEQMPGGVIIIKASSRKTLFVNDNLAKILRRDVTQLKNLEDFVSLGRLEAGHSPDSSANCPLVKALKNNPVRGEKIQFLCGDGIVRTLLVNSTPICNPQGTIIAEIATFYKFSNTEQTQLAQPKAVNKSICLKEVHHQIKNNLQVISALLDLQSEQVQDETANLLLEKSQARIQTMALIYEQLYSSCNTEKINFANYVNSLTQYLYDSFIGDYKHIELILNIEPIELELKLATPCGLIINELVTNSLQHGFKDQDRGKIQIDFFLDENSHYNVHIIDNGSGINPKISIKNNFELLGMSIVESLITEQLNGTWKVFSNNGCVIQIAFPKTK